MLLAAGLLAGLFMVEVSLRILKQPQLSITRLPCIYNRNDETGYRYTPNASGRFQRYFEIDNLVQVNSTGFHDVEHLSWPQAKPRVVVIGDSFVAGLEVEISEGWVQVVQQQLQLTDSQRQQIATLQAQVDASLMQILTSQHLQQLSVLM